MSKALMEKAAVAKTRLRTQAGAVISVTRYGNVMCSRGSVIPLFISQIKNNQPLTITDPHMTRFMMTLDDAIDLVLFAFENAKGGEIFVQKAPACTLQDLAEVVSDLFGNEAGIRHIGTRHGEKLYESLLTREEMARAVEMERYYVLDLDDRDLNYGNYFAAGKQAISEAGDYTSHNTTRLLKSELKALLLSLSYVQNALHGMPAEDGY
jgi:UDP-glucose 4-epimerase